MPAITASEEAARAERRKRVAALYLRGHTQWEIAEQVGVSQGTVSNDIKRVVQWWQKEAARDIEVMRLRELAKIDLREKEALAAWERSKEREETVKTKAEKSGGDEDGGGGKVTREVTVRHPVGDPRFLKLVEGCVEQRTKLVPGLAVQREATEAESYARALHDFTLAFVGRDALLAVLEGAARRIADPGGNGDGRRAPAISVESLPHRGGARGDGDPGDVPRSPAD